MIACFTMEKERIHLENSDVSSSVLVGESERESERECESESESEGK